MRARYKLIFVSALTSYKPIMSDTVRQITYLVSTHVYTARADTTNHQLTSAEPQLQTL